MAKVDVLVPTYNFADTIRESIESLKAPIRRLAASSF